MLGKNFIRLWIFFFNFSQQIGFGISCKLYIGDNLHEMSKPIFWEVLSAGIFSQHAKCYLLLIHCLLLHFHTFLAKKTILTSYLCLMFSNFIYKYHNCKQWRPKSEWTLNMYDAMGKFSRRQTDDFFFFFLLFLRLIWLCLSLTICQPLWVILCCLPEKGREEIVEEMKKRDREKRRTGMKVKKQKI